MFTLHIILGISIRNSQIPMKNASKESGFLNHLLYCCKLQASQRRQ